MPNPQDSRPQPQPKLTLVVGGAPADQQPSGQPPPAAESAPEPALNPSVEAAIKSWSDQLIDTGGRNRLIYYRHLRSATLDLGEESDPDPDAIDDLLSQGRTTLSALFPHAPEEDDEEDDPPDEDELLARQRFADALRRAKGIRRKAREHDEEQGIQTLYLAFGFATWNQSGPGSAPNAPILLSPAELDQRGRLDADFGLIISDEWELNPTLLHILRTEFGAQFDEQELDELAQPSEFDALAAQLDQICAEVPGFRIRDGIALSTFSYAKLPMVRDLQQAGAAVANHPLVGALAGDEAAKDNLRSLYATGGDDGEFRRPVPPAEEFLILDSDGTQSEVINSARAGNHLVIVGPPGTGKSQTISNLIASLAADGKSVLFVAEKRAAIDAVTKRLNQVGLNDLVFDLHTGTRSRRQIAQQLADALQSARTAAMPDIESTHRTLARTRADLDRVSTALHQPVEPWELSPYEMQSALLGDNDAALDTRLEDRDLQNLSGKRFETVRDELREFVNLHRRASAAGQAWQPTYEARKITNEEQLADALRLVPRALDALRELRQLHQRVSVSDAWNEMQRIRTVRTDNEVNDLLGAIASLLDSLRELRELSARFEAAEVWNPVDAAGQATTAESVETLLADVHLLLDALIELRDLTSQFNEGGVWDGVDAASVIRTSEQVDQILSDVAEALKTLRRLDTLTNEFEAAAVWATIDRSGTVTTREEAEDLLSAVAASIAQVEQIRDSSSALAARIGVAPPGTIAEASSLVADADLKREALHAAQQAGAAVTAAENAAGSRLADLTAALAPADAGWAGRLRSQLFNSRYRSALSSSAAIPGATGLNAEARRRHALGLLRAWDDATLRIEELGVSVNRSVKDFDSPECGETLARLQESIASVVTAEAIPAPDKCPWDELVAQLRALDAEAEALRLRPEIVELRTARDDLLLRLLEAGAITLAAADDDWQGLTAMLAEQDRTGDALRLLPRIIELRDLRERPLHDLQANHALPERRGEEDWEVVETLVQRMDRSAEALRQLPRIVELRRIRDDNLTHLVAAGAIEVGHAGRDWNLIEEAAGRLEAASDLLRLLPRIIELDEALDDSVKRLKAYAALSRTDDDDVQVLESKLGALQAQASAARQIPRMIELLEALDGKGLRRIRDESLRRGWDGTAAVRAFEHVRMASLYDHVLATNDSVAAFDRETHASCLNEFHTADTLHVSQGSARILRTWAERVVAARNAFDGQQQLVIREATKKTRHLAMRELFRRAPDVLTALKPCWAMSPLVVAQLLPASPPPFDVVIFDEASQIPPADAISSLLRGRQAIVAGDPKQLPPTAFFTQAGDEDDEREDADEELLTDDVESILDAMSTLLSSPRANKTLGWHYRSKDERLIAFANHHVYNGRMTTFPGALADDCISHVEVPFSPRAVQQRGSNSAEVERVVQLVLEHARERPGESLGVIAFGSQHSNRIEETLLQARRDLPELDEFFSETAGEPFFVKNLERVQGDERDAIILSVGYGRGPDGRMRYAFGPINQEGGYRRLNVAITRAKRRMTVVSAFSPQDLDPDRIRTEGPRLLRGYIAYAASRGADLGRVDLDKPPLNDFEQDIKRRLEAEGINVEPQYGASGYRIDFAAFHPEQPGRPVLAIEADGAAYHSAPSARDRDRLRQEHLERLGWRFHRIWSTEYFRRPEQEIARAVAAWQSAVAAADAPDPEPAPAPAKPAARAAPDPPPPQPQRGPKPDVGPKRPITEFSTRQIREIIDWVNSDGILRTQDETIQEVSRALGFQRRGRLINATISNALLLSRQRREPRPQPEDQDQPPEAFRFTTRF